MNKTKPNKAVIGGVVAALALLALTVAPALAGSCGDCGMPDCTTPCSNC
ncbi:hypothetical protein [Coleofasciculus sp. H7-2]